MEAMQLGRPHLPKTLYRPTLLGTAGFLIYAPALFLVPGLTAYALLQSSAPPALAAVVVAPLIIVAAYGLQLMGSVGHDGTHLCLFRGRYLNVFVGAFYSSAIPTYFEIGFAMSHRNHHRFTNTPLDPNVQTLGRLRTPWQRMLFTTMVYNFSHLRTTVRAALGLPWPSDYRLPFGRRTILLFAWLNFLFAGLWLSAYVAVTRWNPLLGACLFWLPIGTLLILGSAQQYIDHAGLDAEWFRNAWSRSSPLMTAFFYGANFHLEHHMFPGIPSYHLPRVHRFLRGSGFHAQTKAPIESSFWKAYGPVGDDLPAATRGE